MLGQDTRGPSGAAPVDRRPAALADVCRDVREHLDGIVRALAALREDIDRSLAVDGPGEPDQPNQGDQPDQGEHTD